MKAKKIIIPVSIAAGIVALGVGVVALGNAASSVTYAPVTEVRTSTLENKISVSGTVESSETKRVYSKLSYAVEKINVEVGDVVRKGDVLCTINTEDLQQQILQQQASVDASGINTDYNLSEAEKRYNEALEKYQSGENSMILSAKRTLEQAEKNLTEAKRQENFGTGTTLPSNLHASDLNVRNAKYNYDKALEAYEKAEKELDPEHYPANVKAVYDNYNEYKGYYDMVKNHLTNIELDDAKRDYDDAKALYESVKNRSDIDPDALQEIAAAVSAAKQKYESLLAKYDEKTLKTQMDAYKTQYDSAMEGLRQARDAAKTSLENAKRVYDNAVDDSSTTKSQIGNTEENYSIAVKNAEEALENAKRDYDTAVKQAESDLASLKKAAEQQRTISGINDPQLLMLRNLQDKLEYAVITAPCDGVITAVNAEEGVPAGGALFVIQDLSTLKVTSAVGEFDIPYVNKDMSAIIRCDALNGKEYTGKVSMVAPTSLPSAAGSAVNYQIETDIDGEDGDLLAGMTVKVSIISEKKDNALCVSYDAITVDDDGNDAVYVAEKGDDGVYRAKLVLVQIGIQTDLEVEVISPDIKEGMLVLTDTALLSDGSIVNVNENAIKDAEQVK